MSMLRAGEKCTISNTGKGREKQKDTDFHTQHVQPCMNSPAHLRLLSQQVKSSGPAQG